jgi:hypothetical protein
MMGADTIRLGFSSNLCWVFVGLSEFGLGLVGLGLVYVGVDRVVSVEKERARACCCGSGELMVLPKPGSV